MNIESQLQSAMIAAGIIPPECIVFDSAIHRFGPGGKPNWYIAHGDGVPSATFGSWQKGYTETVCAKREFDMTDHERQAMRDRVARAQRARDAERDRVQAEAAARALAVWTTAAPAIKHDYLTRKGVKAHGIRTDGHHLFVPMRDASGKLWSLQSISAEGTKRFQPGGRVSGCYCPIGAPTGRIIVCEGWATGATLRETAGGAVAVAFSAGNLMAVALGLRAKYPDMSITVAADDDWQTVGNPGLTAARAAASAIGAKLAVPNFDGLARGIKDTDWNDMAQLIRAKETAS